MDDLENLVAKMRIKSDNQKMIEKIQKCESLTDKCILAREYLAPQSTHIEKIIKNDLHIDNPKGKLDGDGCKNGINYEIKVSIHSKNSKANFVQIRPDHNVDCYILIFYDLQEDILGKSFNKN
jgi:hypothetical protein